MRKIIYLASFFALLLSSCERDLYEEPLATSKSEKKITYVPIEKVPFLMPTIIEYNKNYTNFSRNSNEFSGKYENLDLDLDKILMLEKNGDTTYSIRIKKEFLSSEDKYFDNLNILKPQNEEYKSFIMRYNSLDDLKEFDIKSFTGRVEKLDILYNPEIILDLENGVNKCQKYVIGGCWHVWIWDNGEVDVWNDCESGSSGSSSSGGGPDGPGGPRGPGGPGGPGGSEGGGGSPSGPGGPGDPSPGSNNTVSPPQIDDNGQIIGAISFEILPNPPIKTAEEIKLIFQDTLNPLQLIWWNNLNNAPKVLEIISYLTANQNNTNASLFAQNLITQTLNTGFSFDVNASSKSPYFIDNSSVQGNTQEEIKFREIYNDLTQSVDFRKMFINAFGYSPFFNAKFIIADIPQTPAGYTSGTCTSYQNKPSTCLITIDRQWLLSKSKVNIAITILHETIHAYLNFKFQNPSFGLPLPNTSINAMDFQTCVNTYYNGFSGNQTQHSFFVDAMIPNMVSILNQIKDLLVTPAQNDQLINPTTGITIMYEPMGNPPSLSDIPLPWNWNDYFTFACYSGLDSSTSYPAIFPPNSNINFIKYHYIQAGNYVLQP